MCEYLAASLGAWLCEQKPQPDFVSVSLNGMDTQACLIQAAACIWLLRFPEASATWLYASQIARGVWDLSRNKQRIKLSWPTDPGKAQPCVASLRTKDAVLSMRAPGTKPLLHEHEHHIIASESVSCTEPWSRP